MLKLKKILSSFVYLVVMLAFTGTIGFEYGSVSITKPGTEVSTADAHSILNLSLISEERDEANDQYGAVTILVQVFVSAFIFSFSERPLLFFNLTSEKLCLKNSLYINFRSLRL